VAAAEALGSFGNPANVVNRLLHDKWWEVSVAAAEGLGKIGDPGAVESLVPVLGHEDYRVRISVCRALTHIGDKRAIEHLIPLLGDEKEEVTEECSTALISFGESAAGPLIKALEDSSVVIRGSAANLLGILQAVEAVEPLIRLLQHKNVSVYRSAIISLSNITGKRFGKDYERWMEWWEKEKRK
jgi:HEAT repeat protein